MCQLEIDPKPFHSDFRSSIDIGGPLLCIFGHWIGNIAPDSRNGASKEKRSNTKLLSPLQQVKRCAGIDFPSGIKVSLRASGEQRCQVIDGIRAMFFNQASE